MSRETHKREARVEETRARRKLEEGKGGEGGRGGEGKRGGKNKFNDN